jgi:hypothetical protein
MDAVDYMQAGHEQTVKDIKRLLAESKGEVDLEFLFGLLSLHYVNVVPAFFNNPEQMMSTWEMAARYAKLCSMQKRKKAAEKTASDAIAAKTQRDADAKNDIDPDVEIAVDLVFGKGTYRGAIQCGCSSCVLVIDKARQAAKERREGSLVNGAGV